MLSSRSIVCKAASNASPPAFRTIPVIDITPITQGGHSKAEKIKVAEELHCACRDVGFFYVKNHGVPDDLSCGVLEKAREWFELPVDVKEQIKLSPGSNYRGYQELGANVTRYEGGFQRDWHEGIDFYKEESQEAVEGKGRPYSPIHGTNPWPVQHPPFNNALKDYLSAMSKLGETIVRGISLGLTLDEHTLHNAMSTKFQDEPYWIARIIHYPPLGMDADDGSSRAVKAAERKEVDRSVRLSCGEHSDYGLLTIVNQEEHISALQVKNLSGQWISADPIPGTFVCNIGDMMKVLTNGLYTPTLHRVVNADKSLSRVSLVYFYEPPYEALIQPLEPTCTGSNPPMFPNVRYGTHLEGKVLSNFEL